MHAMMAYVIKLLPFDDGLGLCAAGAGAVEQVPLVSAIEGGVGQCQRQDDGWPCSCTEQGGARDVDAVQGGLQCGSCRQRSGYVSDQRQGHQEAVARLIFEEEGSTDLLWVEVNRAIRATQAHLQEA